MFVINRNSIAGSAVCAYSLSAFESAFNGPFKHQKDSMSAWMKHENGGAETRVGAGSFSGYGQSETRVGAGSFSGMVSLKLG